jgi:ribosomal protein S20
MRQAMQQRCTQVTDAAGKTLGKSGDDVRNAFKSAAKEQVDKAQDAGRLTEAQANRIKSRIDSDSCVLALGPRGACGPGGHMGPPPMGFRRGGSQSGSQTNPQSDTAPTIQAIPA